MTGHRHRRRHRCGLLAALTVAAVLAGCGGSFADPAEAPLTDTAAHPVVAPGQASAVLTQVDTMITQAGAANDPKLLGARLVGPFRQAESAALTVRAARKEPGEAPTAVTVTRLLVPQQVGWPRWFAAAGTSATLPTPVLRVLTSTAARRPYALWAQLSLLPGARLPEVPRADAGAVPLADDAAGLAMTPAQVLRNYADVLNRGSASPSASRFGRDVLRSQLEATLVAERSALAAVATVTSRHDVGAEPVFALRTTDGGALVIGALTQTYDVTVKPGSGSVQITDPTLAALAGRTQISKAARRIAVEVVAFLVPAAGSRDPVTVVAAERGVVQASGS